VRVPTHVASRAILPGRPTVPVPHGEQLCYQRIFTDDLYDQNNQLVANTRALHTGHERAGQPAWRPSNPATATPEFVELTPGPFSRAD
jgi:hypothetical protein